MDATLDIRPVTAANLGEFGRLLGTERASASCWCLWFVIAVKDFHAGGATANAERAAALAERAVHPLGLLALRDGEAIGWVAAGPRSRYARAVRTPTLASADPRESDSVWLVPCFFTRPDARKTGVARALLAGAVDLARVCGATAVEGFPTAGARRRGGDRQVGTEALFTAAGFEAVHRPSPARVIMRRALSPA